jgi:hypothetical protein
MTHQKNYPHHKWGDLSITYIASSKDEEDKEKGSSKVCKVDSHPVVDCNFMRHPPDRSPLD